MLIDVSSLRMQPGQSKKQELTAKLEDLAYGDDRIEFASPVHLNLNLINVGKAIEVEGEVKTNLCLKCARCLSSFNYHLQAEVKGEFRQKKDMTAADLGSEQEEDIYYYSGNSIDISEMVAENIMLALPMKALCKEHCKGLCSVCGTNLNDEQCNCQVDDIDPRLAVLEKLIKPTDRKED